MIKKFTQFIFLFLFILIASGNILYGKLSQTYAENMNKNNSDVKAVKTEIAKKNPENKLKDMKLVLGKVNFIQGKAFYKKANSNEKIFLEKGMDIPLNVTIQTESTGRLEIKTPENHFIRMWQNSIVSCFSLSVSSDKKIKNIKDIKNTKVILKVEVGKIWNNLLKNSTASRYEVTTPQGVCGVRGTIYSTGVDKNEDTDVYVFDGKVAVENVSPQIKSVFKETFGKPYRIPKPYHRINKPYHQVSKEEWVSIIKSMQHIHISSTGERKLEDFSLDDIEKDEFVKWNRQRDTEIRQR